MRGWRLAIVAAAMTGLAGGAVADIEKGARGVTSRPPSTERPSTGQPTAADDGPIESLPIEGWDGGAYYDEFNDEYYCELSDDYGEGATIWVGWDADGYYLTITDPNTFELKVFEDIDVVISIDDFYKATITAFSLDKDTLDFVFGQDRTAIEAFRKGIKLYFEEWDHWYTLYGLGKAIKGLEDCYNRHAA